MSTSKSTYAKRNLAVGSAIGSLMTAMVIKGLARQDKLRQTKV
jgi:hypothetical protein